MDIFKRIYQEERKSDKTQDFQFIEKDGRVFITTPKFKPEYNLPQYYTYIPPTGTPYLEKNKDAEKRANKFYKRVLKTRGLGYDSQNTSRRKKRFDKYFDNMLKKGINFEYYDTEMKKELLYVLSDPKQIKKLHDAGFDVGNSLKLGYSSNYSKDLWTCVDKIDTKVVYDLPSYILINVVNTRKDLQLDQSVVDELLSKNRFYMSYVYATEVLLECGLVSLTYQQIETLYNTIDKSFTSIEKFPVIEELYEYGVKSGKIKIETPKYTNTKQLSGTKNISKDEVVDAIEDIFESAQNSIE